MLTVIVRGEEHGIYARFELNGQLMISGYALLDAGLISAECGISCSLLPDECARYNLGTPPVNTNAIEPVLLMYVEALKNATEPVLRLNLRLWLADGAWKPQCNDLPLPPPVEGAPRNARNSQLNSVEAVTEPDFCSVASSRG